jgi:hypothetical protein
VTLGAGDFRKSSYEDDL